MAVVHLECKCKDAVNSSDWLCGFLSIQLRPESIFSLPIGTAPWK